MPTAERSGAATYRGAPLTLIGRPLAHGDPLPDVSLLDPDWRVVRLWSLVGKPVLISVVPSLDTGVCDAQTRRFSHEGESLGPGVTVVTISADLPWRQASWAKDAGARSITFLSDHLDMAFGKCAGVWVKEMRIDMRAIIAADAHGIVRYTEYVPEISQHPDYDAAIDAVRSLVPTL